LSRPREVALTVDELDERAVDVPRDEFGGATASAIRASTSIVTVAGTS
jgi:hypothetical protein